MHVKQGQGQYRKILLGISIDGSQSQRPKGRFGMQPSSMIWFRFHFEWARTAQYFTVVTHNIGALADPTCTTKFVINSSPRSAAYKDIYALVNGVSLV